MEKLLRFFKKKNQSLDYIIFSKFLISKKQHIPSNKKL